MQRFTRLRRQAVAHVRHAFLLRFQLAEAGIDSLFDQLSAMIIILEAHDIVLAEIAAGLHFDQFQRDFSAIGEAMHSGVEKHVKLKKKIPVHLVYFTAWVDENGGLHFQPDIYGYDKDSGN